MAKSNRTNQLFSLTTGEQLSAHIDTNYQDTRPSVAAPVWGHSTADSVLSPTFRGRTKLTQDESSFGGTVVFTMLAERQVELADVVRSLVKEVIALREKIDSSPSLAIPERVDVEKVLAAVRHEKHILPEIIRGAYVSPDGRRVLLTTEDRTGEPYEIAADSYYRLRETLGFGPYDGFRCDCAYVGSSQTEGYVQAFER